VLAALTVNQVAESTVTDTGSGEVDITVGSFVEVVQGLDCLE